jgi:hypothetical protein
LFIDTMMKSRYFANPGSFGKPVLTLVLLFFFILPVFVYSSGYAEVHQAIHPPWSGWWWPLRQGGLGTGQDYLGHPAPLEKYNLLATGATSGAALSAYLGAYYDPAAPYWYGLCASWARAASYEHLDIFPSSENNLIFRVGDKKGLLTLVHDDDVIEYCLEGTPEEFHRWLLSYIKDQKKAFVADLGAGEEVWSYPIYKYDMQTSRSGNVESVRVQVYYADDFVSPDYMGTQERWAVYTYDLFLDPTGAITGGEWTGRSIADHPELLSFSLGVGPSYPGLDYQEILRLARSRDDFLEKPLQSVRIDPGTYNLILLDEDVYTIPAVSGDVVSVRIEKQAGSLQDMHVEILDGNGDEVQRAIVSNGSPMSVLLMAAATAPPYTIRLTQDDYMDPNIYTLKVDQKKSFNQEVPYIPRTNAWSGCALTNPGDAAVEGVTLTTRDADGAPIQTVLGPLRLEPGEKRVFYFSDSSVRPHEWSKTERLTLAADGPVALLNLIGEVDRFLAAFVQGDARGSRLVIPDTAAPMTPGVKMFGGVRNESFEEAAVSLRLYSAEGLLQNEVTETIAARGWLILKPGSYPFYTMPASGWIEAEGDNEHILSGFQYTSNGYGVESLFALSVGAAKKIVPLIADRGYWTTRVTLINPNDTPNSVRLHPALAGADTSGDLVITLTPREKRVLEVQDTFGKMAGDPLYYSILEITGSYPLAGYYTYGVINGRDNASYPLLDDSFFRNTLCLSHNAQDTANWWTGVVVCNPSTVAETVRMEPYGHDGRLMEEHVQTVTLEAGALDVFDVTFRFGEEAAPGISFIKFRTESHSGAIGGFYLYGDHGNHILSGANMQ